MSSAVSCGILVLLLFVVSPMTCSPLRAAVSNNDDLNPQGTSWKPCPRYGTFAGEADQDHNCCVEKNKCAINATDLDADFEQLVLRTKRATEEATMLVTRKQTPKSRWEVSLCQVRTNVMKPIFGNRADTGEAVQILQIPQIFEQRAALENCVTGPTILMQGECRQTHKTEEFFTLGVGANGKAFVKREGLLVNSGCIVVVDLAPIRQRLQLEFARPTRAEYGPGDPGTHIETIPVSSLTDLEHHYDTDDEFIRQKEPPISSEDNPSSGRLPSAGPSLQFLHKYGEGENRGVRVPISDTGIPDKYSSDRETSASNFPELGILSHNHKVEPASDEPERVNTLNDNETGGTIHSNLTSEISVSTTESRYFPTQAESGTGSVSKQADSDDVDKDQFGTHAIQDISGRYDSQETYTDDADKDQLLGTDPAQDISVGYSSEPTGTGDAGKDHLGTDPTPTQDSSVGFPDEQLNTISDNTEAELSTAEEPAPSAHETVPIEASTEQHDLSKLPHPVGVPIYVPDGEFDPVKVSLRK